jgi:hypothetical protein
MEEIGQQCGGIGPPGPDLGQRKRGQMLKADRNRWAPPADRNRFIARSRARVG